MTANPLNIDLRALPGPDDIHRVEFENGLVILSRANFNSPSVIVNGFLPAGGLFDPPEKLGLADFTAAALLRGVEGRAFQEIYEALESTGARLGIGSGTHSTRFNGKALVEDLDLLLEILAQALRAPVFPSEQVERLRGQLLTGLAIRAQDTGEMASLAFDEIVYANHPYRLPSDGFPETIQAITRENLVDFHRRCYGPRGMVIVIVGGVEPARAVEKAAAVFGDWRNPGQPELPSLPPLTPLGATQRKNVLIPGKSQADIILGTTGPLRRSPDFPAASLGNNILGQFGMMGRIGEIVREQAGLAYYAHSSLSAGHGPGPWYVSAGVDPENVDQAIELIRREIARFVTEPVSADELADSQANFVGRLPISLESNGGVAGALVNLERYDLGLDYYQRYAQMVGAVTPTKILEAAQRYLNPDALGIGVAGPALPPAA